MPYLPPSIQGTEEIMFAITTSLISFSDFENYVKILFSEWPIPAVNISPDRPPGVFEMAKSSPAGSKKAAKPRSLGQKSVVP